jgi:hypothetical protein
MISPLTFTSTCSKISAPSGATSRSAMRIPAAGVTIDLRMQSFKISILPGASTAAWRRL